MAKPISKDAKDLRTVMYLMILLSRFKIVTSSPSKISKRRTYVSFGQISIYADKLGKMNERSQVTES